MSETQNSFTVDTYLISTTLAAIIIMIIRWIYEYYVS